MSKSTLHFLLIIVIISIIITLRVRYCKDFKYGCSERVFHHFNVGDCVILSTCMDESFRMEYHEHMLKLLFIFASFYIFFSFILPTFFRLAALAAAYFLKRKIEKSQGQFGGQNKNGNFYYYSSMNTQNRTDDYQEAPEEVVSSKQKSDAIEVDFKELN